MKSRFFNIAVFLIIVTLTHGSIIKPAYETQQWKPGRSLVWANPETSASFSNPNLWKNVDGSTATKSPDLVIGNQHGYITLILNDTLEVRKPIDYPPREIKVLQETRLLSVRVLGSKGVVNAKIQVKDENGKIVAQRDLTRNTSGGSCGPNRMCHAIRNSGVYSLEVAYSDGLDRNQSVDLKTNQYLNVNIDRGKEDSSNVW